MVTTTDRNVILTTNNAREEVEDKVLKNRLAQKKFREKKQQKYKELMERVEYLEKMNKELKNNESLLKKQIEDLKQSGGSVVGDDLAIKTGSDRAYSYSEDGSSLSGTSFKGSEDLSQVYNKTGFDRKPSQDTANSFSFPWGGSLEPYTKPRSKTGSTGSISTLFSNDLASDKPSTRTENSEYNFGETADENNFCNNLGDACPYTPSGVNKNIGSSTMKTPLHISADLLSDDKLDKESSAANASSNLNNIDSVFGIPNFSFSPSAFESTNGLETKDEDGDFNFLANDTEFLSKQPDLNNNIESNDVDFFNTIPTADFGSAATDSPMNFNFNYLLDNSIDNKPTIGSSLNKEYSNFSKFDSGFTKKSSFAEDSKCMIDTKSSNDEDENLVVPSDGKFFTCSEIWDRITSNPKLSDIDLDNLCMELKTKARCSERGVLIKEEDLNKALMDHEN